MAPAVDLDHQALLLEGAQVVAHLLAGEADFGRHAGRRCRLGGERGQ